MSDAPSPPPVERRRYPRRWRRGRRAVIGLLVLLALGVIGNLALRRIGPPLLSRISPTTTRVGDTVVLEGQGFDGTLEGNVVYFGDYSGRLIKASSSRLEVEVPDIGVPNGAQERVPVKVEVDEDKVTNAMELVVLPAASLEPGTEPLTEEEEEEPPLASPNPGYASPRATPRPSPR
jgi:hypothetical protein